ncbi:MAG: septum formation initiator family protein [Acidaminococcus sp.]|nr:septum formation initiator family protein [Acidaminococcus sp.]MCI2100590.1 septum formation initiator family protein [Acidaminococcus sp.]MCI2114911.1 septum formation initiator family protein [Acidaminococcus sp.]MCI2116937.1 septum formation initiator family protein [Acidaminococcus sp.]
MMVTGKRKKAESRKRSLGTFVFCLVMALLMVRAGYRVYTLFQVHQETVKTEQKIEQLKAENAKLEQERDNLSDPQYIEKVARDEHNMVGKKEIPLFLVDDSKKNEQTKDAAGKK